LALISSDDPNSSLDVALIKLHDQNVYTVNEIPLGSEPGAPCLYSEKIAKIELEDAEIVTVTASRGLLRGRLSATPTYLRLPHSKNFQKVYTVRLDGTIVEGDCGSLVIHSENGDLYGHIIAGSSGTGTVYIIPANQVFEDLEQRLGGAVSLPTRNSLLSLPRKDTLSSPIVACRHSTTTLVAEAEAAEDIGDAFGKFKVAIGDQAAEATALVSELYAVGSALREIDAASSSPDYGHNLRNIQDDLNLVRASLRHTLDDIFRILGKIGNGDRILTAAAYRQTWKDITYHFQREGQGRLSSQLETHRFFLLALCNKLRRFSHKSPSCAIPE
jgi:hypothetical protein